MQKHKLSISFKRKFNDAFIYINHLKENNENVSDYICKLIEADMKKEHSTESVIQDEVRKVILETLFSGDNRFIPQFADNKAPDLREKKQNEEDKDLLNQLF